MVDASSKRVSAMGDAFGLAGSSNGSAGALGQKRPASTDLTPAETKKPKKAAGPTKMFDDLLLAHKDLWDAKRKKDAAQDQLKASQGTPDQATFDAANKRATEVHKSAVDTYRDNFKMFEAWLTSLIPAAPAAQDGALALPAGFDAKLESAVESRLQAMVDKAMADAKQDFENRLQTRIDTAVNSAMQSVSRSTPSNSGTILQTFGNRLDGYQVKANLIDTLETRVRSLEKAAPPKKIASKSTFPLPPSQQAQAAAASAPAVITPVVATPDPATVARLGNLEQQLKSVKERLAALEQKPASQPAVNEGGDTLASLRASIQEGAETLDKLQTSINEGQKEMQDVQTQLQSTKSHVSQDDLAKELKSFLKKTDWNKAKKELDTSIGTRLTTESLAPQLAGFAKSADVKKDFAKKADLPKPPKLDDFLTKTQLESYKYATTADLQPLQTKLDDLPPAADIVRRAHLTALASDDWVQGQIKESVSEMTAKLSALQDQSNVWQKTLSEKLAQAGKGGVDPKEYKELQGTVQGHTKHLNAIHDAFRVAEPIWGKIDKLIISLTKDIGQQQSAPQHQSGGFGMHAPVSPTQPLDHQSSGQWANSAYAVQGGHSHAGSPATGIISYPPLNSAASTSQQRSSSPLTTMASHPMHSQPIHGSGSGSRPSSAGQGQRASTASPVQRTTPASQFALPHPAPSPVNGVPPERRTSQTPLPNNGVARVPVPTPSQGAAGAAQVRPGAGSPSAGAPAAGGTGNPQRRA